MTQLLRNHITLVIAAAVVLAVTLTWLWSNHRIAGLERDASDAKAAAIEKQERAARLETEAAEYKQKINYLERQLAAIRDTARKQDEELTKLNSISNNARRNVERARRAKPAAVTTAELCHKLAELGYGCQ